METDVAEQIDQLRSFSRLQLLELWQKLYERATPAGIRRELLIPFLAYKVQERAFGGLKSSTRTELRQIARDVEKSAGVTRLVLRPKMQVGTRLLRGWRGQTHEVAVTESGFEYRGVGYRSLSVIARKITGTRWSGPAFFGLRKTKSGQPDD